MAEDRLLAGMPKRRLVAEVKRHLWSYGLRPTQRDLWLQTWAWAAQIAASYLYRKVWPIPSEIAAQYVLLLLVRMQANGSLKLPFRAKAQMPAAVVGFIGGPARPLIGFNGDSTDTGA